MQKTINNQKTTNHHSCLNKPILIIAIFSLILNFAIIGWLVYYYHLVGNEFGKYSTAVTYNHLILQYDHACRVDHNKEACETVDQAKKLFTLNIQSK